MTPLELKQKKVELLRVGAQKAEMELIIEQRLDEIERVKVQIEIQSKREAELTALIQQELVK